MKNGTVVYISKDSMMKQEELQVYDVVYGIHKVTNKGEQFHTVAKDKFFNHSEFEDVLMACKCKSISAIRKIEKIIKKTTARINENPTNYLNILNSVIHNKKKKLLFGEPYLRIEKTLDVPQINNNDMTLFIVGILNTEVLDKSQPDINQTAIVFNAFGLDIQKYTMKALKNVSQKFRKVNRKERIKEDNINPLMNNIKFLTTMKNWVIKNNFLNCFYTYVKKYTWVTADDIDVPVLTQNVINFLAKQKQVTPTDMLFSLYFVEVNYISTLPFALKFYFDSVGVFIFAIMSRLEETIRLALQPIMQEALKKSIESLCLDNGFIKNDELDVNYKNIIYAFKHIGRAASHCGQDSVRSTTDMNNLLSSFIAQLVMTSHEHKSDKLNNSLYGTQVNSFCLDTWTNSDELKKYRAMIKIREWINMLRIRRVFKMHLVSVKQIMKLHSISVNSECSSKSWRDFITNFQTSYGLTVKELRVRHRDRISEENIGPLKITRPNIPDLRTYLFSPEEKKEEEEEEKCSKFMMVDEPWMKRERVAQNVKNSRISKTHAAKRCLIEIKDEIYYNDISEADAKFYVKNRSLVDRCDGDTFEEKIDNAYKFLENDDDSLCSDESDYDEEYYI